MSGTEDAKQVKGDVPMETDSSSVSAQKEVFFPVHELSDFGLSFFFHNQPLSHTHLF